jgi:hypothetical protein
MPRGKTGKAVPSPSFEEFGKYVHATPGRLPVWSYSGDVLDLLLRVSELQHSARVKAEQNPAFLPRYERGTQDAQGVLIRWALDQGGSPPREEGPQAGLSRRDMKMAAEAVDLALRWPQLDTALVAVSAGQQGFESSRWTVRFPRTTDLRYEALDRKISRPLGLVPDLSMVQEEMTLLGDWASQQAVGERAVMTNEVFAATLRLAQRLRAQSAREFDPSLHVAGFTLSDAHRLWDVLFGYAYVAKLLTTVSLDAGSAVLSPTYAALAHDLQVRTGIDEEPVQSFLDFLTYVHGHHPDPAIAPIIARRDRLLIPLTLVATSNFERNLLRALALRGDLYGPVAKERGRAGADKVAALLRTIPDVLVTTGIEVRGPGGRTAGDLDVVAVDPKKGIGLILEVKWPAPPDHMIEILRVEAELQRGQQQLAQLKRGLANGTLWVRGWPASWPSFQDMRLEWMALGKDYLPGTRAILGHEIRPISWDLLWARQADTLAGLIQKLTSERDLPAEGRDFERVWHKMKVGRYEVEIEGFELFGARIPETCP